MTVEELLALVEGTYPMCSRGKITRLIQPPCTCYMCRHWPLKDEKAKEVPLPEGVEGYVDEHHVPTLKIVSSKKTVFYYNKEWQESL